jgi:flagellar biosynthesis protein FliQ
VLLLGLLFFACWMLQHLMTFAVNTFEQIPIYIR